MLKLFLTAVVFLSFFADKVYSQEIKANVFVNVEQLVFEARNYVMNMKNDVENYINNQKFTNIKWEGDPIPVDITIFLSGGSNQNYSAKLVVVSRRFLDGPGEGQSVETKFYDQKWSFNYGLGANLKYNTSVFEPFRTLLDYYMLLVIGYDMDTYAEAGGNPAFDMAKSEVLLGAANGGEGYETFSQPGDFTRYNLVTELTDLRYDDFRKLVFAYYIDGLDRMAFNKEEALKAIQGVIADMAKFKKNKLSTSSVMMQAFFDCKAQEIASLFNGYADKSVFADLKYLDPANSILYDDSSDGKSR